MVGEVAVGGGHERVEQLGVVAARDHHPHRPPGQRRHLDGVHRPGQLGGEHALHVLVAQRLGQRDHQVRGVPGEARGVVLVGQPGGQPGSEAGGADPLGEHIGVEEVLLDELAERRGELVLALDDHRRVRYRQAQRTAEQRGHREPVRDTADHGRLGAGLHVAEQRPVRADRGHRHEQRRDRRPAARWPGGGRRPGGAPAVRPTRARALDTGEADVVAAGSIWRPRSVRGAARDSATALVE